MAKKISKKRIIGKFINIRTIVALLIIVGATIGIVFASKNSSSTESQNGESLLAGGVNTITAPISNITMPCYFAVWDSSAPELKVVAENWLAKQPKNNTIRLIFTMDNYKEEVQKQKYNCSTVTVQHEQHGPVCKQVMEVSEVCVDTFPGCNVNVKSSSCSSFRSISEAEKGAQGLVKNVRPGRKVTITGHQSNAFFTRKTGGALEECSNTATITVTDTLAQCTDVSQCRKEGETCSPPNALTICKQGEKTTNQYCCFSKEKIYYTIDGKFSAPGQKCKPEVFDCKQSSYWDKSYTTICPGSDKVVIGPDNAYPEYRPTFDSVVSSCSAPPVPCTYTCNPGYERVPYLNSGKCVPKNASSTPKFSCAGTITSNAQKCPLAGTKLVATTTNTLVSSCSPANEQQSKCENTCKVGYSFKEYTNPNTGVKSNICVISKPCLGAVPENANLCPDTESIGSTAGTNHVINSCLPFPNYDASGFVIWPKVSDFCAYTCKAGFTNVGGKCVAKTLGTNCLGVPSNAKACAYTDVTTNAWTQVLEDYLPGKNLSEAVAYLVPKCSGLNPVANNPTLTGVSTAVSQYACQATCNSGYAKVGNTCKLAVGQCTGSAPTNANLCPDTDKNVLANTPRKVVTSCDQAETTASPASCRYICKSGYVNDKGACRLAKCTGSTPSNASLCPNTNKLLTSDTSMHYGSCPATNTASDEKCVFQCKSGYEYNPSTGGCIASTCPRYQQKNSSGQCVDITPVPGTPPAPDTSCGKTSCPVGEVLRDGCCYFD